MSVVSFRSSTTVTDTVSTSIAVSKPTGTADGDLLVMCVYADSTTNGLSNSVPAGWTTESSSLAANVPSHGTLAVYWKIASSEGATWTWGWPASSGHKLIVCGCWTGHGGVATDANQMKSTSAASTLTTDALTQSETNILVVYGIGIQDFNVPLGGMDPITYDAAVTPRVECNNDAGDNDKIVALGDEVVSAGNVPARTFSWPESCAAGIISMKPVLAATVAPAFGAWAWQG